VNNFGWEQALQMKVLIPGLLSSLMLLGSYPITQVYQHEEDGKRGDRTISLMLGIRGTFYFTVAVFTLATAAFFAYFSMYQQTKYGLAYLLFLSPVLIFFGGWFFGVLKDEKKANHSNTMRMNFIASTCLNAFFVYLFMEVSQIGQLF
jgi:1,4-dihydroxy-2-naphthoate octaprenyltransferase